MARYETAAITADGRTAGIRIYNRPRSSGAATKKTLFVGDTFGGGTATLQISNDGGTTYGNFFDESGAAVTFTNAKGGTTLDIPSDDRNPVLVAVNLAGATSPNLTLTVYDAV